MTLILFGFAARLHAAEVAPFFRLTTQAYSEPVSLNSARNRWVSGTYYGGEHQWSSNWAEAGVQYGAWGVSALTRYDADIRFSRDTAELFYRIKRKLPLDIGRTYQVDIEAANLNASGLRLNWASRWRESRLKLVTGLSLLKTRNLQHVELRGRATPFSSQDFDFFMSTDYHYDEDFLFFRPNVMDPEGTGIALDLQGELALAPRWRLNFEVRDLMSRIWWPDAPFTTATASTGTKSYDSNGYVVSLSPALQGVEGFADYTQRLTPATALQLHTPLAQGLDGSALYRYQFGMNLWGIGVATSGKSLNVGARYWPSLEAVGLELRWGRLATTLTLDGTDLHDIRTAWFNLEYR